MHSFAEVLGNLFLSLPRKNETQLQLPPALMHVQLDTNNMEDVRVV